ncbi:MAG: RecX family transcriptional regulator [Gemmatimonadota bacterium]
MTTITALDPDPRREGSVRVVVDGRPFGSVPLDRVAALGLAVGREVDEALRLALGQAADEEAAFRTALSALGRRPFARRDLARRLRQKGHEEAPVALALARAERLGLIDDQAFAERYVLTRSARGRGPARLRRELLAMGVEARLVDAALAATAAEGDPARQVVARLAARRARQLAGLPLPDRRRRLRAFLARRGFTGETARAVVDEVLRAS